MSPAPETLINVTLLEPARKHPYIFENYDQLRPGEALTLLNDHDPKPLYYQLLAERGPVFRWEYLQEGPDWWKVRITRNGAGEAEPTIGELVATDWRKAAIFKKYGLDFCCGGKKTVREACREKGMDVAKVEKDLSQQQPEPAMPALSYHEWDASFLCDYIIQTHHRFVRRTLPDIRSYAEKVKNVHGHRHPELHNLNLLVENTWHEMMQHMVREEDVFFPAIRELEELKTAGNKRRNAELDQVLAQLELEHEVVGGNMAEIRDLTRSYTVPEDACASYRLLYQLLEAFESDLHLHVHLENNILFPRVQRLRESLAPTA